MKKRMGGNLNTNLKKIEKKTIKKKIINFLKKIIKKRAKAKRCWAWKAKPTALALSFFFLKKKIRRCGLIWSNFGIHCRWKIRA